MSGTAASQCTVDESADALPLHDVVLPTLQCVGLTAGRLLWKDGTMQTVRHNGPALR